MPHHAPDLDALPPLATVDREELDAVGGGFMQILQGVMGLAGNMINKHGDDKAKQGFGMASNILGQVMPMISQFMGGAGGGAQGGGTPSGGAPSGGTAAA